MPRGLESHLAMTRIYLTNRLSKFVVKAPLQSLREN